METEPSDEFSYTVKRLADDLCSCEDVNCARGLRAQYDRHVSYHSPSDERAEASAAHHTVRMVDCQDAIEAGKRPRTDP